MIVEELLNTRPMALAVMACRIESEVLRYPREEFVVDFAFCNECCFQQRVFAKLGSTFDHENDKTSILFRQIIPTDTIDFELIKDGVKVADLNGATLGEYFNLGSFPRQEYKGFILDWQLVLSIHGAGCYTVRTQLNRLGVASVVESIEYLLTPYTDEAADETTRIDVVQNGYLVGNKWQFDYTGMDWPQQVRLVGKFNKIKPEYSTIDYQNSQRITKQIQDEIKDSYSLELSAIPKEVYNTLVYEMLLANETYVTDYNLHNSDVLRAEPVKLDKIEDMKAYRGARKKHWKFEFKARQNDTIKRNVR